MADFLDADYRRVWTIHQADLRRYLPQFSGFVSLSAPRMSSSTTFLLTPSSTLLPSSPALHLLPFSLGSSSTPYTSISAPLSTYFHPRTCPPGIPSVPEGTPLAAFRGRQLVGQVISIPRGYRGIILSAGKRPDQGGIEVRSTESARKGKAKEVRIPFTASSTASTFEVDEEVGEVRRSPRKPRGAGQVALSRPKPRQAPKRAETRKRYRIDSDDEVEDEELNTTHVEEVKPVVSLARTPSKRMKITGMMGVSPIKGASLPNIVVQAPTPHKPLRPVEEGPNDDAYDAVSIELEVENEKDVTTEEIVPSPATENDPPNFSIAMPDPTTDPGDINRKDKAEVDSTVNDDADYDNPIRALRPISSFESFTLWTLDAPLPGFRPHELDFTDNPEDAEAETGTKPEKGWWRTGGAGEGGDEIVRAMGEWLGLVEMVSENGGPMRQGAD